MEMHHKKLGHLYGCPYKTRVVKTIPKDRACACPH